MPFSDQLPAGYENNYREWYLVVHPPQPGATTTFPGISTPQPDHYARAGAIILAPAAGLTDYHRRNQAGGSWRWIPAAEAHALLAGQPADNADELRRLQERLAAKQAVIDRCRAWLEEARP